MLTPALLFLASLATILVALFRPGMEDLFPLAVAWTLASLWMLARALAHPGPGITEPPLQWVVVDGSNVMHWKDKTPRIETVREVLDQLTRMGFTPGVVFDANAGYLLSGKYQHDGSLGRLLGLPEDRVMVVPRGTPADPAILASARSLGARVVSNDRYRDWAETHPEVHDPAHLIRGDYDTGQLRLNLA